MIFYGVALCLALFSHRQVNATEESLADEASLAKLEESLGMIADEKNVVANALNLYPLGKQIVENASALFKRRSSQIASIKEHSAELKLVCQALSQGPISQEDLSKVVDVDAQCVRDGWLVDKLKEHDVVGNVCRSLIDDWKRRVGEAIRAKTPSAVKLAGDLQLVACYNLVSKLKALPGDEDREVYMPKVVKIAAACTAMCQAVALTIAVGDAFSTDKAIMVQNDLLGCSDKFDSDETDIKEFLRNDLLKCLGLAEKMAQKVGDAIKPKFEELRTTPFRMAWK